MTRKICYDQGEFIPGIRSVVYLLPFLQIHVSVWPSLGAQPNSEQGRKSETGLSVTRLSITAESGM